MSNKVTIFAISLVVWMILITLAFGAQYIRDTQLQDDLDSITFECNQSEVLSALGNLSTALTELQGTTDRLRSDVLIAQVDVAKILKQQECPICEEPATCPECARQETWVELNGPWAITWYGSEEDGTLGKKHGAAWAGLECRDYAALTTLMPDTVTESHFGLAMPGAEWYCQPIKVCVDDKCVIGTAVDVMDDYRIEQDGIYYSHVDVWSAVADELGMKSKGIVYDDVKVYVGILSE